MRSSNWEQSKYSSAGEWINNPYNGILFCNKNKGTTNICSNRDESWKHSAKWIGPKLKVWFHLYDKTRVSESREVVAWGWEWEE